MMIHPAKPCWENAGLVCAQQGRAFGLQAPTSCLPEIKTILPGSPGAMGLLL